MYKCGWPVNKVHRAGQCAVYNTKPFAGGAQLALVVLSCVVGCLCSCVKGFTNCLLLCLKDKIPIKSKLCP